jgi:hypothetical protein
LDVLAADAAVVEELDEEELLHDAVATAATARQTEINRLRLDIGVLSRAGRPGSPIPSPRLRPRKLAVGPVISL